jgi:hypothetical protein
MARRLQFSSIVEARRTDRLSESRPGDFRLGPARPVSSATGMGSIVPYCLDILRRRSLYVGGVDLPAMRRAPFYYLHARNKAQFVVSVPWARQSVFDQAPDENPVYVFSAGRVGSTLLCAVLERADVPSLSEPDFYTQLANPFVRLVPGRLQAAAISAAYALSRDLMAAFAVEGRPLVVKLRSECCRVPRHVLFGARQPRTIFMTRDFESWARSSLRVFRRTPSQLVERYVGAARCYAQLCLLGPCHLVRYENLLANPEDVCAGLSRFLGVPMPPAAAHAALQHDAQHASPLDQGRRPPRIDVEDHVAATLRIWQGRRCETEALLSVPC